MPRVVGLYLTIKGDGMSNFSQFLPSSGATLKFQEFTSSGTFTPSTALTNLGGWVFITLVAGGAGGANTSNGAGGGGGQVIQRWVKTSGATTVTIGAGGNAGSNGNDSVFGSVTAGKGWTGVSTSVGGSSGGAAAQINAQTTNAILGQSVYPIGPQNVSGVSGMYGGAGGASGQEGGGCGVSGARGGTTASSRGGGGGSWGNGSTYPNNAAANSGGGGAGECNGGSGYCLVQWLE